MIRLMVSSAIPRKYPVTSPRLVPTSVARQRRERGDKEDVARAREHAGEDVSTEAVGAEPVRPDGASPISEPGRSAGRRGDAIAEERAEEPEEDDPTPMRRSGS